MYNSYSSPYSSYGSYGGYSSYGGLNNRGYGSNMNNSNDPNQNPQQPNQSKQFLIIGRLVVEEYFKMMNGLRSILEIGFALVALTNFTSKSYELLKKIVLFLLKTSKKFSSIVYEYFPFKE